MIQLYVLLFFRVRCLFVIPFTCIIFFQNLLMLWPMRINLICEFCLKFTLVDPTAISELHPRVLLLPMA